MRFRGHGSSKSFFYYTSLYSDKIILNSLRFYFLYVIKEIKKKNGIRQRATENFKELNKKFQLDQG
jgi:hypothetical protein